ncbi:SGNH/GDSL hydrolase family protein [Acidovorax sp.]|uniref:SGNH/GDSL hydrolase family protein n=1 Tax=Acidovorax sp. TaxID=1872122 RepID=UPI0027B9F4A5|nr:SGNH/GDSL hydrolase family protein [Acidovorax sp.]
MKKLIYILLPSLVLCALVALGYWAGLYTVAGRFDKVIRWVEQGETLAGVLAVTPLKDEQRNHYARAYTSSALDIGSISWSVPNQPTPFVGTAPSPGQHQNAHINSWQMRNSEELQMPKPEGVYRIFLTGGSTAYGSGAPSQEQTIGSLLNDLLNKNLSKPGLRYEVFTFANPAWASTQERIAIENYLSELQPDLVISLSGNNDVFWADAGRNVLWFSAFSDDYFKTLANTGLKTAGRKELQDLPQARPLPQPVPAQTVAYRLEKNVRLGANALQDVNWVFFLQPTLSVTKKSLSSREKDFLSNSKEYYLQCYQAISERLSTIRLKNFEFVDISGVFDRYQSEDDMFLDQFHFGDKGNAIIAQAILASLAPKIEFSMRKN